MAMTVLGRPIVSLVAIKPTQNKYLRMHNLIAVS